MEARTVRGRGRILKTLGAIRRWFKPGGVILMYHRVIDLVPDTYNLAVSPVHFAEHMHILRRNCVPMSLAEMIDAIKTNTLPNRAVAVTFDDGYYDNYSEALPLLRVDGIPATVFVVSSHVDSQREFWWDELERAMLMPQQVPPELRLYLNGKDYVWETGTLDERSSAHQALHMLIAQQDTQTRTGILEALVTWAGVGVSGRPTHRVMRSDEMLQMVSDGLIEVGGHTVTHPTLSALSVEAQRREIAEGCRQLEAILGRPIDMFAYPYGRLADWEDATADLVRQLRMRGAVTTVPGCVESGADPFRLRRWAVGNWDGEQFARELESFFVLREGLT